MSPRIGVCSWSLQPRSVDELVQRVQAVGVSAVQLALDPLRAGEWSIDQTVARLQRAEIEIRSGMIGMPGEDYSTLESIRRTGGVRLAEHWEANLANAGASAELARRINVGLVTFHAGFLPHERSDPSRKVMIDRLRAIIDRLAAQDVAVGLETGQETAETLLDVLDELDRPEVGVNFDPANMILYGMGDPVAALRKLAPRVVQIHVKDARASETPATWGTEVPAGGGEVDWSAFFEAVRAARLRCDLMIEREAGRDRVADIRQAYELLKRLLGSQGQPNNGPGKQRSAPA
ncbi:MAG: sugar phosphate isomerase/epimerase family protein [Phycisphaerae bacterium]